MTTMLFRAAAAAGTVNPDKRTVDLVFATDTPVKRYSWDDGYYLEVLEISRAAVDTSRIETGAVSLLDTHDQYSMDSRLGSVVADSFRIEGGKAICTVKFSRRERADAFFQDIADGLTTPVSVGYRVLESAKTEGQGDALPTITATKWLPLEVSLCPVPADGNSHTRSEKDIDMTTATNRQPGPLTPAELSEQSRRLVEAERCRANEIRALARDAGYSEDDAFVTSALESDTSVSDFKSILLEKVLARSPAKASTATVDTYRRQDATETMRNLAANAILHRSGLVDRLEDGAREWRGLTAIDIARETLRQRNENDRGAPSEVVERALHTTSDFVAILSSVTSLSLMSAYSAYENTFPLIANKVTVPDFREAKVIDVGSAPDLLPLNEHGEFKAGTVRESEEGIRIFTSGRTIGLTRQLIINDQLGVFTQAVSNWGRKAAKLEGDIVWNVIVNNAKLQDGKGLFHIDHGNLAAAGTALDEANLVLARRAFRAQKDIDGQPIDMTPKYLFTGADLEITAQKLLHGITAPQTPADVVPQAIRSMTPVYEHRLDALPSPAWFLFASASSTMGRGLVYAYLAGREKPRMNSQIGFNIEGIEYSLAHDFGAGLTDYRFAYKNPGV